MDPFLGAFRRGAGTGRLREGTYSGAARFGALIRKVNGMLVDSHCHLDYLQKEDPDLSPVIARARTAGVATLVTICTKLSAFQEVLGIAERFENVYCSVGVHPHEAGEEGQSDPARLIELAAHEKVVGIGKPAWITITSTARARRSGSASAPTSMPRGRPVCL